MIVKWVARKIEEYNLFEIPFQDHKQNHAGRTKQRGGPWLHMSVLNRHALRKLLWTLLLNCCFYDDADISSGVHLTILKVYTNSRVKKRQYSVTRIQNV